MKTIQRFSIAILLFSISFTACQKDEEENQLTTEEATQQMIVASEDNSTAEDLFQSIEDESDLVIENRGGGGNPDCPTVTVTPSWTEFPRTVTIDFGTVGCEGADGRIRMGIITVVQTAEWWVEDAVRTTTFTDFSVDGAQIEGVATLTNEGFDAAGNVTFSRKVENAKITFPNGDVTTWEADQLLTQIDGGSRPFNLFDNVFEFTSKSNGVNRNGQSYTAETLSPLVKNKTCPWLVSGVFQLEVDGYVFTLDHGDGTCDKYGTLTFPNGTEMEIELGRTW